MLNKPEHFPPSRFIGSKFVAPIGPENASIMIIGEAPGQKEDETGICFVGKAGAVLDKLLYKAGIGRENCYITNVVKYKPPKNDITTPAAQFAVQENIPYLLKEIRAVKPTVIVPVGRTALKALGFNYKISDARGSVIESSFGKIIPTYHPASVFYERKESDRYFTMTKDWHKIARHAKNPNMPYFDESRFILDPRVEDVELFCKRVKALAAAGQQVVLGTDIETYYVDNPIDAPLKSIGMAINERDCIVVPFITESFQYHWKNKEDLMRVIMAIGSILGDESIEKMYHNALFDVLVLMNHGFPHSANIYDTMLARNLIYHLAPDNLAYLISTYTDYPPWKLQHGKGDMEQWLYNARDCVVMHMARPGLDEDIRDNSLTFVKDIVMRAIKPVCMMMLHGLKVDIEHYEKVKFDLEQSLSTLEQKISAEADIPNFNINSPKQLSELLFQKLKLRSGVKSATGNKSTSEDVINRLSLRYPEVQVLDYILDHRKLSTRYKSFVKNLKISPDGCIHASVSMSRVVTGRFSFSKPPLHSLPKRKDPDGIIRSIYVAREGNMLCGIDYSQIELYVFAVLAGDEIWLDAYANQKDTHAINMEAMIGYYDPKYRTFIKNFVYGLIYGSTGQEIAKVAPKELIGKISVKDMLENLWAEHPWLFQYRKKVEDSVLNKKHIANAFNRKRWYPAKPSQKDLRSAINFPIQSTVADIMNIKIAELREALPYPEVLIPLQWHDAFYIEAKSTEIERYGEIANKIMQAPIDSPLGYHFEPRTDIEFGKNLSMKS